MHKTVKSVNKQQVSFQVVWKAWLNCVVQRDWAGASAAFAAETSPAWLWISKRQETGTQVGQSRFVSVPHCAMFPKTFWILSLPLIHLKNSLICQRSLYSSAMVFASRWSALSQSSCPAQWSGLQWSPWLSGLAAVEPADLRVPLEPGDKENSVLREALEPLVVRKTHSVDRKSVV